MKLNNNIILTAALFALTACVGGTKTAQLDSQSEKTELSEKPNKMTRVCKESIPTGSRIPKKTCRTKEAWDEIERIAQQRLDNATKPQSNNPKGG